jgi:hypothetical protein
MGAVLSVFITIGIKRFMAVRASKRVISLTINLVQVFIPPSLSACRGAKSFVRI